jgi:hypothetical protein
MPVLTEMAGTGITRRKSTWLAEPLSEGNFLYRIAFWNISAEFNLQMQQNSD